MSIVEGTRGRPEDRLGRLHDTPSEPVLTARGLTESYRSGVWRGRRERPVLHHVGFLAGTALVAPISSSEHAGHHQP
jgi:hypothetical protein